MTRLVRNGTQLAALVALVAGCSSTPSRSERPSPTRAEPAPARVPPAPSPEAEPPSPEPPPAPKPAYTDVRLRSLAAEHARAELRAGGLFIDLGSDDAHKYTRGGWKSGWGAPDADGETGFTPIVGKHATLNLWLTARPEEIVVRIRSRVGRQRLSVEHRGRSLGRAKVGREWTTVRVPGTGLHESGRARIQLSLRRSHSGSAAAEIDWLWIRTADRAALPTPGPRAGTVEHGDRELTSLLAPTSRSYSFYLQPRAKTALAFQYGAATDAAFSVRAETSDGATHTLFTGRARPGLWTPARVELGRFAGDAIRLELATDGDGRDIAWGDPAIVVPRPVGPRVADKPKPAKNVVMMVMDTCRADLFKPVDPESTVPLPSFDAFAKRSATFSNAYQSESWTKPTVATMLSGTYPSTHRAYFLSRAVPAELLMLPEHLDKHGFQTAAIVANPLVTHTHGYAQGFDTFTNTDKTPDETADRMYDKAIAWLKEHHDDGRFMLYIHTMECHSPYEVARSYTEKLHPQPYRGSLGEEISSRELSQIRKKKRSVSSADIAWIRAVYQGEARFQDEHMGRLFTALEQLSILDDTMVVITNDHGEELLDHGSTGHVWTSYDELVRAPLLIHYPPLFPPGRRFDQVVELVDLAPTIVATLGLPDLPDADGDSILALTTGASERRLPDHAVIDFRDEKRLIRIGRWKLEVDETEGWTSLYDLNSDPGEKANRMLDRPLGGRFAEVYLGEALARPRKRFKTRGIRSHKPEAVDKKLDSKTADELEALGYIER